MVINNTYGQTGQKEHAIKIQYIKNTYKSNIDVLKKYNKNETYNSQMLLK